MTVVDPATGADLAVPAPSTEAATPRRRNAMQRLLRDPAAVIAGVTLLIIVLAAIFAPLIAPHDPYKTNIRYMAKAPGVVEGYWLGTDKTGRDLFSRILYGTRLTLLMGFIGVFVGGILGAALGILAAYYKRLDSYLMRAVDVMLAFPAILFGLALAATLGPGISSVIIALVIATVPDVARVARGAAVGVAAQEYMEAGRAVGVSDLRLIWRYLTLNCISTIFVFLTLRFGQVILIGAALSFLGLGAQPPTAELGMMASDGRDLIERAPHVATIPSLVIFIIVLAANVLGDALRDALDPRLRR